MEEYNYDLLAGTITMEEITYNEKKQDILRRIKENDIQKVAICDSRMPSRDNFTYSMHYESHEMGWLGYFIGRSSSVKELHISVCRTYQQYSPIICGSSDFCRGIKQNKSIQQVKFYGIGLSGSFEFISMLDKLFRNSHNLRELHVVRCELGMEGTRLLSLALASCNKSLKHMNIDLSDKEIGAFSWMGGRQLVNIIASLKLHSH